MPINWKKTLTFLLLTFGVNWGMAAAYYASGGKLTSPIGMAFAISYMFIPMLMAILTQKIFRKKVIRPLGISFKLNRWYLAAIALPLMIAFAAFAIALLFPDVAYSAGMEGMIERYAAIIPPEQLGETRRQISMITPLGILGILILQGSIAACTVNGLAAFGEELGWRGLLLRELAPLGFWRASFLIGAIWGIWHAPIIIQGYNYPQHPLLGILLMTLFCMLVAPLFGYIRLRARSVIAAAVMHGALNGFALVPVLLLRGGDDLTTGITGGPGLIAYALACILLYWYDTRRTKAPIDINKEPVSYTHLTLPTIYSV